MLRPGGGGASIPEGQIAALSIPGPRGGEGWGPAVSPGRSGGHRRGVPVSIVPPGAAEAAVVPGHHWGQTAALPLLHRLPRYGEGLGGRTVPPVPPLHPPPQTTSCSTWTPTTASPSWTPRPPPSLWRCVWGGQHTQTPFFWGGDVMLIHPPPPLQSFRCSSPRKMPFSKMDPSCALGFYARRGHDLDRLCAELRRVSASNGGRNQRPPLTTPPSLTTTPPHRCNPPQLLHPPLPQPPPSPQSPPCFCDPPPITVTPPPVSMTPNAHLCDPPPTSL